MPVIDEHFMRLALAEARQAFAAGEAPVGAVVVLDGEVIAAAHNRRETDADPTAHAELLAIRAAANRLGRWRLAGCTLYVTLEPCLMCAGLLQQSRLSRVVFGADDPKAGALGSLYEIHLDGRLNHSFAVSSGILAGECSELLRDFFDSLRNPKNGEAGDA